MDKILITGGKGMLGSHLQQILPNAHYVGSEYDLRDWLKAKDLFKNFKPTHVIHLAARVGGIQDNISKPAEYIDDNILINTNVLKLCLTHNVKRFTAMLSTCAYPNVANSYPMEEEILFSGPPAPTNFSYGYSKRCLAVQIGAYNKQYGTKYNYIIPCNLYSEYDNFRNKNKMHFVTALLKKIKESKNYINLLGTGNPLRQFMYAGDLARVIKEIYKNDIVENFNVAPDYNYSINDMAIIAINKLNPDLKIKYSNPELDGQYRKDVSSKKMKNLLPNFKFTSFEEGIEKVYKIIKK
jgi:GDP-L-fucose synthase